MMKQKLSCCVAALLLSGCVFSKSAPSQFYVLPQLNSETNQTISLSQKSLSLGVEKVKVPVMLNKPQIVLKEKESSQIVISETNRWAEPLSQTTQSVLIDDMSYLLPNAYIKTKQYTDEKYDYILNVEINQMIGAFNQDAVLDVWWEITFMNGKQVMRSHSQFKQKTGATYQDYVETQGRLWALLAKEIAIKLTQK